MSAQPNPWNWDTARQKYYRVVNGAYFYQDGSILSQDGRLITAPTASNTSVAPQTQGPTYGGSDSINVAALTDSLSGLTVSTGQRRPSVSAPALSYGPVAHAPRQQDEQLAPQAASSNWIRGTPGEVEPLNRKYKRRQGMFKRGRVFKILWPEPLGSPRFGAGVPSNISQVTFGELAHVKIAWFVVAINSPTWSLCLRIQTYGGQGCGKPGIVPSHHATVHTSTKPPKALPNEHGMLDPIKVSARSRSDRLDPKSRLNFAKIYTIEHNVKVYDFGRISSGSMEAFNRQFLAVFHKMNADAQISDLGEVPDEEEDDDDDDNAEDEDMHSTLVRQYAAYLAADRDDRDGAYDLLQAEPPAQREKYAQLMKEGVPPAEDTWKVLLKHFDALLSHGSERKSLRAKLAKADEDGKLAIVAGLLEAGYALP